MTDKTKPFSIRLTSQERADLRRRAGKRAVGDFVRELLFGEAARGMPVKRAAPIKAPSIDRKTAAQGLALLGKAELASNLKALSEVAQLGALPVTPETETALARACRDVSALKSLFMAALGIRED